MVSKITHDLRTPLNAILGFSELLSSEPNLTDTQRAWLQTMGQSGRYLLGLIHNMLETAKIRAGKITLHPANFQLLACLEGAISLVLPSFQQKGLVLRSEISSNLPTSAHGDRQKLTQILLNLLNNALKFTNAGEVLVRACYADDWLHLEVQDTGIGIPESQLNQIFESFAQADNTQGEGTGLGLAIAHQYTELMGGTLHATSQLGQGSTFWLRLPMPAVPEDVASSAPSRNVAKPWLRLLVAEDNPTNQQVMVTMLARLGHTATVVPNGREALAILERQSFDLVFMDVDMPEMDGITATQEIYQTLPFERQPPIVGVTALIEKRDRCLQAGMFEVLAKPIRPRRFG
ncbi:MAG: response regulator [Oscillatoriales cyanobacterium SM2_1_8]|nr:response regulator [Oscillatoriales cyanobacterium SM2_1_8]